MKAYLMGVIGTWIVSDGIYSWVLYAHRQTWGEQKQQTFWHDHWVRLVRILCGLSVILFGVMA